MNHVNTALKGLVLLLFVSTLVGCDAFESINPFNNEKEVEGTVEAVGDAMLTVDAIDYAVTANTTFEDGYTSLSDVSVGDRVEVEYEEVSGGREALEIEPAD